MDELAKILIENSISICSLESFTVGNFASKIGMIPSISKVYKGSLICYQSIIKETVLKVSSNTIKTHGVVSKEVALEMAARGIDLFKSDLAIAFTGNAGPTAMEGKQVGLIYYAIHYQGKNKAYELLLEGSREEIIKQAIDVAISSVLDRLKEK